MRLLKTINKAASEAGEAALEDVRLERALSGLWDQLDKEIKEIAESVHESGPNTAAAANPVLEEILVLARQQTQMLASAEAARPFVSEQILELGQAISRISSLPHPDHFVWRDLAECWTKFRNAWAKFSAAVKPDMMAGNEEEFRTLLDTIVQVRRPIEFSINRRAGTNSIEDSYRVRPLREILTGRRDRAIYASPSDDGWMAYAATQGVPMGETPIVARATADKPPSAEGGPASPGGLTSENPIEMN